MGTLHFEGKVVVVTGATGGLGKAICHAFAQGGAAVVAGYHRSGEAAQALVRALPAHAGARHAAVAMPVTDSAALRQAAATVKQACGRVDVLVNCAGTTRFVPHDDLDALDDALIDTVLATNVRGPIAMVRAFRPLLDGSESAVVVNISSVAARTAMGSNIAYCASKAALDNLTASLARALAPRIRVVSVSPGLVDTDFVQSMEPEWRNTQARLTPLGRLASPDEVATTVLAVAGAMPFTTGVAIPVDGGRPLH
ncbi:SDR family NAD(P)-dependent oxidoreductase [Cupriavidus nantongensis]|uniref:Short-chain dehydrogenase n=1 Tax=Cupriavidus nantongensis TaxID=1796606 RepID=A0A142JKA3_9BURK|nr:SDR family oxidoreductase [Cupriavidus nantongensis]AMR78515.1 short-chain dehydrogenase [Cupriavidus nantongensis]